MSEEWKDVIGYCGLYQVSSLGRVKTLARGVKKRIRGTDCVVHYKERILSQAKDERGYLRVSLWDGSGKEKKRQVHGLVLSAFVGPRPEGMDCCHNNGNPSDNRIENLRWDTRKNNMADAKAHGTIGIGATHHNSKWSYADRKAIVSMSPAEAKEVFGCSFGSHLRIRKEFGVELDWRTFKYAKAA